VCVEAFLDRRMRFTDLVPTVERVLGAHSSSRVPSSSTDAPGPTVEDVLAADAWARSEAGRAGPSRDDPKLTQT
jgi:1-deoxy-D-xylulose-5-phosphate reductoisomerase